MKCLPSSASCIALVWTASFACSSSTTDWFSPSPAGAAAVGDAGDSGESGANAIGGMSPSGFSGSGGADFSSSGGSGASGSGAEAAGGAPLPTDGASAGVAGMPGGFGGAPSETPVDEPCAPGCCDAGGDLQATILADSVQGFSATQGKCGWSFGYLPLGLEPFTLLPLYDAAGEAGPAWTVSTTHPPWLAITSTEQHPRIPPLALVDRRWTSTVSGSIAMRGHVARAATVAGGDGIVASIRVAGVEVWRKQLAFDDTAGENFELTSEVEVGTTLDFIVAPGDNEAYDATTFTAKISR